MAVVTALTPEKQRNAHAAYRYEIAFSLTLTARKPSYLITVRKL